MTHSNLCLPIAYFVGIACTVSTVRATPEASPQKTQATARTGAEEKASHDATADKLYRTSAESPGDSQADAEGALPEDTESARSDEASIETLSHMSLEELLQIRVKVSSKEGETVFHAPSVVAVVESDAIREFGLTSIPEALQLLAGVNIYRTPWMRDIPTIRGILQDHFTNKVLVLIDGVPSWMSVTGEAYVNRINIEAVERIEVLRGPASVLYGTNAYAGAINIVLRRSPEAPSDSPAAHAETTVHARVGELNHLGGGAHVVYREGDFDLFLGAQGSRERGYHVKGFVDEVGEQGDVREFSQWSNVTARANLNTSSGAHTLLFNTYMADDSYFGAVTEFIKGAGSPQEFRGYLGHYRYSLELPELGQLSAGTTIDYSYRDFVVFNRGEIRGGTEGIRNQWFIHSSFNVADWLTMEIGADFDYRHSFKNNTYQSATQDELLDNNMTDRHVWEQSAFGQVKLTGKALDLRLPFTLLVGARYTKNELFDENVSLRGSAVFPIAQTHGIKVVAGQSYRAPTPFELFYTTPQGSRSVYGNEDLRPETSSSIELAYVGSVGDFFVQTVGYLGRYGNKIMRQRLFPADANNRSMEFRNSASFDTWGAELELRYRNPEIANVFLTYAFSRGTKSDAIVGVYGEEGREFKHSNFRYVPEHTASLGVSRRIARLLISTTANYIGRRRAPMKPLGEEVVVDFNLGYRGETFEHMLSLKNLTDEESLVPDYVNYQLNSYPIGYPRRVMYSVRARF